MDELLRDTAVTVELQPILRFPGPVVSAYEALGRGLHPDLPRTRSSCSRSRPRWARRSSCHGFPPQGGGAGRDRPRVAALFLNTHPRELEQPGLVDSMEELRAMAPHLDLTLEIHESALAQPEAMAALRDRLSEINVGHRLRRLRRRPGTPAGAGGGPAALPEVRPQVRLEIDHGSVLAPAPAGLAGGRGARAAREDRRRRRRDRGRSRGLRQARLHPCPGLPLRPSRPRRRVLVSLR